MARRGSEKRKDRGIGIRSLAGVSLRADAYHEAMLTWMTLVLACYHEHQRTAKVTRERSSVLTKVARECLKESGEVEGLTKKIGPYIHVRRFAVKTVVAVPLTANRSTKLAPDYLAWTNQACHFLVLVPLMLHTT